MVELREGIKLHENFGVFLVTFEWALVNMEIEKTCSLEIEKTWL